MASRSGESEERWWQFGGAYHEVELLCDLGLTIGPDGVKFLRRHAAPMCRKKPYSSYRLTVTFAEPGNYVAVYPET